MAAISLAVMFFIPTHVSAGINQWTAINTGLTNTDVRALIVDPAAPATLYAGTWGGGVFKSTDSGANWAAVNTGLTNTSILSLAIDPITPATLYAGTNGGGVFKSMDSGASWAAMNNGLLSTVINALAIDPVTPMTLYVGTGDFGVFKSTDGAVTWTIMSAGLAELNIRSLAVNPKTPAAVYVGLNTQGMFTNWLPGPITWEAINTGLTNQNIRSLLIDPVTPATLYVGTWGGGVFKSTNYGLIWAKPFSRLSSLSVYALAIDPVIPTTLYAGTGALGVFKSMDGAGNWVPMNAGLLKSIAALAIDPVTPAIIYAGTGGLGVFKFQASATIALNLNPLSYITGDMMTMRVTTVAGPPPGTLADIYIALQLPDGTLLVMQPDGSFGTNIAPLLANVPVPDFTGPIFNYTFSGAEPVGNYTWFAALTTPGTLNVIGTMAVQPFSFTPANPVANLVVNEVDYDNPGSDFNEFIEIYNSGTTPVDLTGVLLSLVNGLTSTEYASIDLSSAGVLVPGGYLVVASAAVAVDPAAKVILFPQASNNIQNGAPDGLALVDSINGILLDALSYEGGITAATVTGITGAVNLVEAPATPAVDANADGSLIRSPNGVDTDNAAADWVFTGFVTPGASNILQ